MIFIANKYTKYYYSIISNAKSRTLSPETYTEKHHIIPESFYKTRTRAGKPGFLEGDGNAPDNLVMLTAREHFICHWLLTKMVSGPYKHKMIFALNGLKRRRDHQEEYETKITGRVYDHIKSIAIEQLAKERRGQKLGAQTNEHRKKISLANIGKHPHSGEQNPMFGKTQKDTTIELMKLSHIKTFKVVDPTGQVFLITGTISNELTKFCSEHGITTGGLFAQSKSPTIRKRSPSAGWRCDILSNTEGILKLSVPKPKFTCEVCGKTVGGKSNIDRHTNSCLKKRAQLLT